MKSLPPIFATFLPQYHRDPYNDKWWGEGFTEWDNVKNATRLFKNHAQPKKPTDGYFDLSDAGEIERQYKLANKYGIDSFMIYHYWSDGVRLLSKPLDQITMNPNLDVKFSLCWANHPWTRTWRNRTGALDILLPQNYSEQRKHMKFLCDTFSDKRYSKISGRPIFSIYKPTDIPSVSKWCNDFRKEVIKELGVEPYLIAMVKTSADLEVAHDFDAINIFQPSASIFGTTDLFNSRELKPSTYARMAPPSIKKMLYRLQDILPSKPRLHNYQKHSDHCLSQFVETSKVSDMPVIPMVCTGFDNTPRYKSRATILTQFNINSFSDILSKVILHALYLKKLSSSSTPPFIVINSWNEWGEGMFLQPDEEFGLKKLLAVKEVMDTIE